MTREPKMLEFCYPVYIRLATIIYQDPAKKDMLGVSFFYY